MKRALFNLLASLAVLGMGWLVPHSVFSVKLETQSPIALEPASSTKPMDSSPLTLPEEEDLNLASPAAPVADPLGEVYFTLLGSDGPWRLVRLPGACVVGLEACPEVETVPTPFDMQDVFSNGFSGLIWAKDGSHAVLVTHPEDDLSRGRTAEELALLQTQSPEAFEISPSTIYLFDPANDSWQEIYQAPRKFVYPPVWSADGQWLAFTVWSSQWAFHPLQADDGVYVMHPDGTGLQHLANVEAEILGWIGNSVAIRHTQPYPATAYRVEMLALDGTLTPLFASSRTAYYTLAPDGGAFLVSDAASDWETTPQKSVDLFALDGSVTHAFGSYNNQTTSIWATAWSSDSTQIAYANLRRVYVAPRDGTPTEVYLADDTYVEPSFWQLQFSPDQKFLLMDVYDGTPKFVVVSLETGTSTTLTWPGMLEDDQAAAFSWRP